MSLRLLCCASSLDGGGSERQLWQLASQLPSEQFDKQLYLLYRRGPYLAKLPANILVHAFSDLNFHGAIPGAFHRAQVSHLEGLLRQQRIDVVYDRTYHMTLITSKACRRAQVRRVSVIVSPPSYDFVRSRERFRWFKFRSLRRAYSDPSAVTIAVSQAVAQDAADFFRIPLAKILVIPNPVDIEAVQQAAFDLQDSSTFAPSEPIAAQSIDAAQPKPLRLIVVGRMTEEKGHRLMLEAVRIWESSQNVASLGHLHLDLVGDGPLRLSLERLAIELGIAEFVHFHGFQANPYPWIANADILCIPSLYEGLPNVALEAMALKKPVIATPSSDSLIALLGDTNQRGQLLSESKPECFVDALKLHIEHPRAAVTRAELAYEWISQYHGLRRWITTMSRLLQEAVAGKDLL